MFEPNQMAMQVLEIGDEWFIDEEFENIAFCNGPNILGNRLILPAKLFAPNKPVVLMGYQANLENIKHWLQDAADLIYLPEKKNRTFQISITDKLNGNIIEERNYELELENGTLTANHIKNTYSEITQQINLHDLNLEHEKPYEIVHQKPITGVHIIKVQPREARLNDLLAKSGETC